MFVSRRLPLLCLPYVFVSKIASFHSRLPFRHQWVRFQTHFLSENSVMDNRRKWKNPCELQHYMRAKNWLCCVMSTENVMSLSKSLRAVSLMEASTQHQAIAIEQLLKQEHTHPPPNWLAHSDLQGLPSGHLHSNGGQLKPWPIYWQCPAPVWQVQLSAHSIIIYNAPSTVDWLSYS